MKIQIDIPNDINKQLKIERVKRNLKNMEQLIIFILNKFFKGGQNGK